MGNRIKLLVDGIFFQINNTGIARVWKSILEILAKDSDLDIYVLDRGNFPALKNITLIPFPQNLFRDTAADSILIEKICKQYEIDVFSSTYYTSPVSTPMILMVHDMIPELFAFDLSQKSWQEKDTAICFSQRYLCVSNNTKKDLQSFYPEIPSEKIAVQHNGVDRDVFCRRDLVEVEQFRKNFGLNRDYFLFVGSRVQHNGYKNSQIFFDAVSLLNGGDFDVLCVGGEEEIENEVLNNLPTGVNAYRTVLTDAELAQAYGGASALVYPSLYEGFGLPVIEAMACGCPVITTSHGSLKEAAGDAACLVSGTCLVEMSNALVQVRNDKYRAELIDKGISHAKNFTWQALADCLKINSMKLHAENQSGMFDAFYEKWTKIREIQASVDFEP